MFVRVFFLEEGRAEAGSVVTRIDALDDKIVRTLDEFFHLSLPLPCVCQEGTARKPLWVVLENGEDVDWPNATAGGDTIRKEVDTFLGQVEHLVVWT